ncbi:hypothetical protein AB1E33_11210 [Ruegeria sp. 2012CJ15-1]
MTFVFFWAASDAKAETQCEMLGSNVPELEKIKSVFAQGNYRYFFELTDRFSSEEHPDAESIIDALFEAFPSGFSYCSTLFSEKKSPVLVNEVSFFEAPGGAGVFVAWSAFLYRDQWDVIKYTVSTEFDEVLWALN